MDYLDVNPGLYLSAEKNAILTNFNLKKNTKEKTKIHWEFIILKQLFYPCRRSVVYFFFLYTVAVTLFFFFSFEKTGKPLVLVFLFVSGAYIVQKHKLTCMEVLQKVQTDVTVTTNRIYDDIISVNFIDDYGFIAKYLTKFQNLSFIPRIPTLNVSVPWIN